MNQIKLLRKVVSVFFVSLVINAFVYSASAQSVATSVRLEELAGKYLKDSGELVYVFIRNGELRFRPVFWQSIQPLSRVKGLEYEVSDRRNRKVNFSDNDKGQITKLEVIGFGREDGVYNKIESVEKAPIELLFEGKGAESVKSLMSKGIKDPQQLTLLGYRFWSQFPSKRQFVIRYYEELLKHFPNHSDLKAALGHAYVTSNERDNATKIYKEALKIEPKNDEAIYGLSHLDDLPKSLQNSEKGWELPFSLEQLFAKPTADEIKTVEDDWSKRDLSPKNVVEIARSEVNLGHADFLLRIISHEIFGKRHYGAIFTPIAKGENQNRRYPVILETKGVSPDFFPLNISGGPQSAGFLGDRQGDFIYVMPSFRGEILIMNDVRFQSEGDRTNVWDGATDDALTFLNVALESTPNIDTKKIISFGRSRGGSVALLAGIRSKKITHTFSWAGPTDFFELMGKQGWSIKETVRYTLSKKSKSGASTQFVETFLLKAINNEQSVEDVRKLMIASSPIYFTGNLKDVQLHYGVEDWIVPLINGTAFEEKLKNKRIKYQSVYYENSGHDLDYDKAPENAKKFFVSVLEN